MSSSSSDDDDNDKMPSRFTVDAGSAKYEFSGQPAALVQSACAAYLKRAHWPDGFIYM